MLVGGFDGHFPPGIGQALAVLQQQPMGHSLMAANSIIGLPNEVKERPRLPTATRRACRGDSPS